MVLVAPPARGGLMVFIGPFSKCSINLIPESVNGPGWSLVGSSGSPTVFVGAPWGVLMTPIGDAVQGPERSRIASQGPHQRSLLGAGKGPEESLRWDPLKRALSDPHYGLLSGPDRHRTPRLKQGTSVVHARCFGGGERSLLGRASKRSDWFLCPLGISRMVFIYSFRAG